mgnify:FL=1
MDDLYQSLLDASFHFISYRPRSEKEIRDFLIKKLHGKSVANGKRIEQVLERLRELEYLDDTKFIRWWVEQRSTYRPKGRRLLEQELLSKGIDKSLIVECLNTLSTASPTGGKKESFSEVDLAKKAIEKKLKLWEKLPRLAFKQKVYAYLSRRGFSWDTIHQAIDSSG